MLESPIIALLILVGLIGFYYFLYHMAKRANSKMGNNNKTDEPSPRLVLVTTKRFIIGGLLLLVIVVILFLYAREHIRHDASIFEIHNSSAGLHTQYYRVIEEWGEPISREIVSFGETTIFERLLLHYDGITFSFVRNPGSELAWESDWQSVSRFYITSSEHRLVGRERLSVGSSIDDVEQALLRRNIPGRLSETDSGHTILTTGWREDRIMYFTLDENNLVTKIKVRLFL